MQNNYRRAKRVFLSLSGSQRATVEKDRPWLIASSPHASPRLAVLQLYLTSHKPVLRFAAVRLLNKVFPDSMAGIMERQWAIGAFGSLWQAFLATTNIVITTVLIVSASFSNNGHHHHHHHHTSGGVLPRKNFGGQISSLNSHQNFPGGFEKTHHIFPAQICPLRNLLATNPPPPPVFNMYFKFSTP